MARLLLIIIIVASLRLRIVHFVGIFFQLVLVETLESISQRIRCLSVLIIQQFPVEVPLFLYHLHHTSVLFESNMIYSDDGNPFFEVVLCLFASARQEEVSEILFHSLLHLVLLQLFSRRQVLVGYASLLVHEEL